MSVFKSMKSRLFLPALAALSVFGMAAGYAAHAYAEDDDCCEPGAPCCQPGAPCCAHHHKAPKS
jgi:hypothetical protein